MIPPTAPQSTAMAGLLLSPKLAQTPNAEAMKMTAAPMVPIRRADAGSFDDMAFTSRIPSSEQKRPTVVRASGRNMRDLATAVMVSAVASAATPTLVSRTCPPSAMARAATAPAMAMDAIWAPQYDSKMSEPMPATSPTLSPTLSAMTPGLRGSSSGIPASTLPTRSAPTSAALVKMPPPTR